MKSFTQKLAAKLKYARKTPYIFEEKKMKRTKVNISWITC